MARADASRNLVCHDAPKSSIAEMYRVLRTNLEFASLDSEIKRVVVTSSIPGEGKTTTTSNLAVVNAQLGKRTLLIDADLRRPMVHRMFRLSNARGLTSVLIRQSQLDDAIQQTDVPNLSVLTSGPVPPNPAEVLGSSAMKSLLEQLSGLYDLILLDSPPVLSVTDARLLATACDGVLYVVGAGQVSRQTLRKAAQAMSVVNARILGTALNNKKLTKAEQQYYYYHYE